MTRVTEIFNPIYLNKKIQVDASDIVTILHLLSDQLSIFGHHHFNKTFISRLKLEMGALAKEANKHYDLKNIPCSKMYNKNAKENQEEEATRGTGLDWKKDAGEYATHIFGYRNMSTI